MHQDTDLTTFFIKTKKYISKGWAKCWAYTHTIYLFMQWFIENKSLSWLSTEVFQINLYFWL